MDHTHHVVSKYEKQVPEDGPAYMSQAYDVMATLIVSRDLQRGLQAQALEPLQAI
jgi:hypothetical protein